MPRSAVGVPQLEADLTCRPRRLYSINPSIKNDGTAAAYALLSLTPVDAVAPLLSDVCRLSRDRCLALSGYGPAHGPARDGPTSQDRVKGGDSAAYPPAVRLSRREAVMRNGFPWFRWPGGGGRRLRRRCRRSIPLDPRPATLLLRSPILTDDSSRLTPSFTSSFARTISHGAACGAAPVARRAC